MRESGSGVAQRPRPPDAIGEVAFGRRTDTDRGATATQQPDVALGGVGDVHGSEARFQSTPRGQQGHRREPVRSQALIVLRRLLADVGVKWDTVVLRPRRDQLDGRRVDRSHGVDGCTHPAEVGGLHR